MFILSQYLTNENIWVIPCPTSQISVLGIDNVKKSHVNYSDEQESRFGEPVNGNQQFIFQRQQYHLIMLSDRQPYKKTFARHSPLIKYKMTLGKIWLSLTVSVGANLGLQIQRELFFPFLNSNEKCHPFVCTK